MVRIGERGSHTVSMPNAGKAGSAISATCTCGWRSLPTRFHWAAWKEGQDHLDRADQGDDPSPPGADVDPTWRRRTTGP
jgi:hypothetical protein